jgi:hypothetical protein
MSKAMSASDETLDPEAARLAARIRRMMLISGATTLLAIGTVFAVIGYRVFKAEGSTAAGDGAVAEVTASLPKGARVLVTEIEADVLAVTIQVPEGVEVRTFDARTLQPKGRLRLVNEP